MAKIDYAFPIEKVHGKISKKHRIGFAHLNSTGRNFTVEYGKRTTSPTAAEVAQRDKFTAVAALARDRMIDPNFIPGDQVGFRNQTKYKTLWGYVFRQVWNGYEG